MDEHEESFSALKLNNIMEKCGMKNKYQIISLIIIFALYGTSEFLAIALPFMEINPFVTYYNTDLNKNITIQVDYNLCKNELKKFNYTIDNERSRSSLVTDFNVFCSENEVGFIGSSLFFGVMIGSFISYIFSDKIGRKKTSVIFSFIYSLILCGFLLIKNIYLLYTFLFLTGMVYSIIILSSLLLLNEVLDVNFTAIFTTIIYNAYPVFGVFYNFLFKDLNNWRAIFIVIAIIHFISTLLLIFFLEESPRFYFVRNDINNMEKVLLKIARVNNKEFTNLNDDFCIKDENEIKYENESLDDNKTKISLITIDNNFNTSNEKISLTEVINDFNNNNNKNENEKEILKVKDNNYISDIDIDKTKLKKGKKK